MPTSLKCSLLFVACLVASPALSQELSEEGKKIYTDMQRGGLPSEFHKLEIESKWNISESQYRAMLTEFKQGQSYMGHSVNIRWGGMPKVFIDVYYDTPEGDLAKKGQVLRFRKRLTMPLPKNLPPGYLDRNWVFEGSMIDLKKIIGSEARGLWIPEWGRVQFKERASLRGAAWFRYEVGDSLIWRNKDYDPKINDTSGEIAERIIKGEQKHEAMEQLLKHHDQGILSRLQPTSEVTDVRYRVEFLDGDRPAYEVSVDRLETRHLSGERAGTFELGYEGELEILPVEKKGSASKGITPALIDQLYKMSAEMQANFKMEPSRQSKGGVSAFGGCRETEAATTIHMF